MKRTLEQRIVGYSETGQGRPLVFVHGYPLSREMWEPQLSELGDAAHILAPDLWGFGESAPLEATGMGSYAELVRGLLDALGLTQPVVLCGHSMGGYVVLECLRRFPERVAAVILTNTRAQADSAEGKAARDRGVELARAQGAGAIAAQMLPKLLAPETFANRPQLAEHAAALMSGASVTGIVAALRAMRDRPDSTELLARISQPALVIGAAGDQIVGRAETEEMARQLPRGRSVIVEAAGHLANLEQPEEFNRAVREFLQQL